MEIKSRSALDGVMSYIPFLMTSLRHIILVVVLYLKVNLKPGFPLEKYKSSTILIGSF